MESSLLGKFISDDDDDNNSNRFVTDADSEVKYIRFNKSIIIASIIIININKYIIHKHLKCKYIFEIVHGGKRIH